MTPYSCTLHVLRIHHALKEHRKNIIFALLTFAGARKQKLPTMPEFRHSKTMIDTDAKLFAFELAHDVNCQQFSIIRMLAHQNSSQCRSGIVHLPIVYLPVRKTLPPPPVRMVFTVIHHAY